MTIDSISAAFQILNEEISAVVIDLQEQGSKLLVQGLFDEAQNRINSVQRVIEYKNLINNQEQLWNAIYLDDIYTSSDDNESSNQGIVDAPERFETSNINRLILPILDVLIELGGTGKRKDIINRLGVKLIDQLTDEDWQCNPHHPDVINWQNCAARAFNYLLNQGYIIRSDHRGLWEVTAIGRNKVLTKK